MSNHYHLVPYVDRDEAQNWDADEVIRGGLYSRDRFWRIDTSRVTNSAE
jgi:uncharacterized membrane-anchored protein